MTIPNFPKKESLSVLDSHFEDICKLTDNIDFYIDQLSPMLAKLTVLNLSSQQLHDGSGIFDNIS